MGNVWLLRIGLVILFWMIFLPIIILTYSAPMTFCALAIASIILLIITFAVLNGRYGRERMKEIKVTMAILLLFCASITVLGARYSHQKTYATPYCYIEYGLEIEYLITAVEDGFNIYLKEEKYSDDGEYYYEYNGKIGRVPINIAESFVHKGSYIAINSGMEPIKEIQNTAEWNRINNEIKSIADKIIDIISRDYGKEPIDVSYGKSQSAEDIGSPT